MLRDAVKNYLTDFLRGYPPPYPLNGKSFCQKTLKGKLTKIFLKKWVKRVLELREAFKNYLADFFR